MATTTVELKAEMRTERGTRASRRLRSAGRIPGVIYGHQKEVLAITLPARELLHHLTHGAHLFSLNLGGQSETVLVKDVQYDHLGSKVLHVDFNRVDLTERVEVTVPLELKGTPKGEADGGVLTQVIAQLQVECLVTEIPEVIRHNVADMGINDVLHIRDIKLPPGVRCLQDGELIVAIVKEFVEEVAATAPEAEGPAEPELIGRKPAEEEEPTEQAPVPEADKKPEKEKK